jgi:hypothetical protein
LPKKILAQLPQKIYTLKKVMLNAAQTKMRGELWKQGVMAELFWNVVAKYRL